MAYKKISEMDAATLPLAGTEIIEIVQSGANKKVAVSDLTVSSSNPVDVTVFTPGKPNAGAVVLRKKFAFDVSFPASLTDSQAVIGVNPTSSATYSFKKNGVEFGTLAVATDGTLTWTSAAGASFTKGSDLLTIVAPGVQDATLSDVSITLLGSR